MVLGIRFKVYLSSICYVKLINEYFSCGSVQAQSQKSGQIIPTLFKIDISKFYGNKLVIPQLSIVLAPTIYDGEALSTNPRGLVAERWYGRNGPNEVPSPPLMTVSREGRYSWIWDVSLIVFLGAISPVLSAGWWVTQDSGITWSEIYIFFFFTNFWVTSGGTWSCQVTLYNLCSGANLFDR